MSEYGIIIIIITIKNASKQTRTTHARSRERRSKTLATDKTIKNRDTSSKENERRQLSKVLQSEVFLAKYSEAKQTETEAGWKALP